MRKSLCVAAVVTLVLVVAVAAGAGQQNSDTCVQSVRSEPPVEGNGAFQLIAPQTLRFEPGVEFEVFNDGEPPYIEYKDTRGSIVIGPKRYCRCADPEECPEESCFWTTSGDVAECHGGCHKENGDPCLSCDVFDTPGTESASF